VSALARAPLLSSLPYRTSLPHRCRDFSPGFHGHLTIPRPRM